MRNQLLASNINKECTCNDVISSIQGDMQHLQSVVDNNAFSYAEIVKKVELKQKQHPRRKSRQDNEKRALLIDISHTSRVTKTKSRSKGPERFGAL